MQPVYIQTSGSTNGLIRVRDNGGSIRLQWEQVDDNAVWQTWPYAVLPSGDYYVELVLKRASNATANDGTMNVYVNGSTLGSEVSGLDIYNEWAFDQVDFGVIFGGSNTGSLYLDQLKVTDDGNLIGAHLPPVGTALNPSTSGFVVNYT